MQAAKVPFKVTPKGRKDGRAMAHRTLCKMGLIEKTAATTSGSSTLTLGPFKVHSTFVKSTVMDLLHKLMQKVLKVLKNQRTLASNQRQLAVCYNTNNTDHPIELGSVNGSDSDDEPEGEESFDVPSPQLWENPHSEDEEVASVIRGGDSVVTSAAKEDDGDEDDDDGDDDDDNDEEASDDEDDDDDDDGVGHVIASESSDVESE